MRRPVLLIACAACMTLSLGCSDQHSQTRITQRLNHMRGLGADIAKSERRRQKRLEEACEVVEEWWRHDVERFQSRASSVGDYIW